MLQSVFNGPASAVSWLLSWMTRQFTIVSQCSGYHHQIIFNGCIDIQQLDCGCSNSRSIINATLSSGVSEAVSVYGICCGLVEFDRNLKSLLAAVYKLTRARRGTVLGCARCFLASTASTRRPTGAGFCSAVAIRCPDFLSAFALRLRNMCGVAAARVPLQFVSVVER